MARPSNFLKDIWKLVCCLVENQGNILTALNNIGAGSYNEPHGIRLEDTEDITFAIGDVHSVAWAVEAGGGVVNVDIEDSTPFDSSGAGGFGFTSTNTKSITFTADGGPVNITWTTA